MPRNKLKSRHWSTAEGGGRAVRREPCPPAAEGQQAVFVIDLFMVLPRAEDGVKEVEAVLRTEEG